MDEDPQLAFACEFLRAADLSLDGCRRSFGQPALCTRRRREVGKMVVPPGNHKGSGPEAYVSVRRKVSLS